MKNTGASVRQKILNLHRKDRRPFQELVQYYAMERFLFRLSMSQFRERFILKGALMLRTWGISQFRPTMDIDMLGITSNDQEIIVSQIKEIIRTEVADDGIVYHEDSVKSVIIKEDADYQGVRITFTGDINNARFNMQIDIGFGDVVIPEVDEGTLPTLLNFEAPVLRCYSRETTIAEKFQAMIHLGYLNSRMKDFYDIWILSRQFDFDGATLQKAIQSTLTNRETMITLPINSFSREFIEDKSAQWKSFCKRIKMETIPEKFETVVNDISEFLTPIAESIISGKTIGVNWSASNAWFER